MKTLISYMALLLFSGQYAWGQTGSYCSGNCLTNGTFPITCPPQYFDPPNLCPSWADACNGWYISHGSPQEIQSSSGNIKQSATCPNPNAINMWSQFGNGFPGEAAGEGIYTAFPFTNGQSYDMRINFTVSVTYPLPAGQSNGTIYIYAANGVQEEDGTCGGAIPVPGAPFGPTQVELIQSFDITGSSYTSTSPTNTFTFQVNTNSSNPFTQLWIYPDGSSTHSHTPVSSQDPGTPYLNFTLSSVFLCPHCPIGTQAFNSGTLPISAINGTIDIGTTDGPPGSRPPVTAESGVATNIVASNLISVVPNFNYAATGSGILTLSVAPCNSIYNMDESTPDVYDSINIANASITDSIAQQDSLEMLATGPQAVSAPLNNISSADSSSSSKLQIFPTVSSGAFTVTGSPAELSNANIIVVDESGRTVYSIYNATGTTIPLDLGNLPNGLYFVQIRQPDKVTTQKIIISK